MDDLDQAWTEFQKSQSIQKASLAERLDTMAAQLNEIQTTSNRTAKLIPKLMGDEAAISAAADQSAMMGGAPMGGPMGAAPGGAMPGMDPSMGAAPGGAPMGGPMGGASPDAGGMGAPLEGAAEGAGMGNEEENPLGGAGAGMGDELGGEDEEMGMLGDEDEDLGDEENYGDEEEGDLGDGELGSEDEDLGTEGTEDLGTEDLGAESVGEGDADAEFKDALKMAVDTGNMELVAKLADAYSKLKGGAGSGAGAAESTGDELDLGDLDMGTDESDEEGSDLPMAEGEDFAKSADEEEELEEEAEDEAEDEGMEEEIDEEEGDDSDEEELKEGIDKLIEAYLNGTIKEEEAKLDDDVEEEAAEEEAGYDTEPEDEPKAELSEEGSEPFEESEFASEAPVEEPVEEPVTKSAYFAEIEGTSFRDLYNIKKSRAFVGEDGRGAIQKAQQPSPDATMESAPSVGSTATIPSDVQEQKQSTKDLMNVPDALNNTNEGDATAEQGGSDSFDDTGDEFTADDEVEGDDVDLPGTEDALTEEGDLAEDTLEDEEEEDDEDLDEIEDDIMKSATVADEVECPCKDLGKGHKPVKGEMLDDVGHKKKKSEHKARGGDLIDDVDEVKKGSKDAFGKLKNQSVNNNWQDYDPFLYYSYSNNGEEPKPKGKKGQQTIPKKGQKLDAETNKSNGTRGKRVKKSTEIPDDDGIALPGPTKSKKKSTAVYTPTVTHNKDKSTPTVGTTARFGPKDVQASKTAKSAEKQIMSMRDVMAIRKSGGRPDASTSVNGDITRPELGNIMKSAEPAVRMGRGVDPHKVVENDWNEYKIYKAQRGI